MDYLSDLERGKIKEGLELLLAKQKVEFEDAFFYLNTDKMSEEEYTALETAVKDTELLIEKIDTSMEGGEDNRISAQERLNAIIANRTIGMGVGLMSSDLLKTERQQQIEYLIQNGLIPTVDIIGDWEDYEYESVIVRFHTGGHLEYPIDDDVEGEVIEEKYHDDYFKALDYAINMAFRLLSLEQQILSFFRSLSPEDLAKKRALYNRYKKNRIEAKKCTNRVYLRLRLLTRVEQENAQKCPNQPKKDEKA